MKHLISYWPLNRTITFWDNDLVNSVKLEGHIELFFSSVKKCVGWYDGENYYKCPHKVMNKKRCNICSSRDISKVYTRLDYRGYEDIYKDLKDTEFSLYIASFGPLLKAGVTRKNRVLERAEEQGADFFCEVANVRGADLAYSLEQYLQNKYNLRNFVTTSQKMRLINNRDISFIDSIVSQIKEDVVLKDFLTDLKILRFDYRVPSEFKVSNHINGDIISTKGQIIFYSNNGENFAVNLSSKIGHEFNLLVRNGRVICSKDEGL